MEPFGLIITIVLTGMGIIIGMGALVTTLFLWNRNEANADRRDIVNLMFAIKEDAANFREETANFRREMGDEMKDFHRNLCRIEERQRKG